MRRRGFTLVEILTVIGIVAIFSGLMFAAIGSALGRARHTACAENLRNLGAALYLYANDHDGWVPPASTLDAYRETEGVLAADVDASPGVLVGSMHPYVKDDRIWFCPADRYRGRDVLWLAQKHRMTSYFFFPQTEGQRKEWPPRMQLGRDRLASNADSREDIPLLSDAIGIPAHDSMPGVDDPEARSNHPDDLVNAIRHDLSLSRLPAKFWMGAG